MAAVDTAEPRVKKKGGKRPKKRVGIRIDMTPMVDVAFLLLIFFMVTTVFRAPQTMEINLPPPEQKVEVAESNLLVIYVAEDNSTYWGVGFDKPEKVDLKALPPLVVEKNKANPKLITLVKLDRKARYHMMIDILDELNIASITRFSIAPLNDQDKAALARAS